MGAGPTMTNEKFISMGCAIKKGLRAISLYRKLDKTNQGSFNEQTLIALFCDTYSEMRRNKMPSAETVKMIHLAKEARKLAAT